MISDVFQLSCEHYGVIPPLRFKTYDDATTVVARATQSKPATVHYHTMSTPEIMALPVADLAAKDSVLLLWTSTFAVDCFGAGRWWSPPLSGYHLYYPKNRKSSMRAYVFRCSPNNGHRCCVDRLRPPPITDIAKITSACPGPSQHAGRGAS
jgi:hypothetical protein